MDSSLVKEEALKSGADICGIGSIERFAGAPERSHPKAVLLSCKSVIVLGIRFNASTMNAASASPYTVARNTIAGELNRAACSLALAIADEGYDAVPIGSIGPDDYDEKTNRYVGTISLKHSAVLCGLGKMGKNTLLISEKFGNMLWLAAVLTSAELAPDPIAAFEPCTEGCTLCLDGCPVKALDGVTINQKACREYAFGSRNGGEWKIHCFECRKVCPRKLGIKKNNSHEDK